AQAALELPVRIGVHTGTPLLAGEGYVGMDVNRAARIAAAGHGGQVLVSPSTRALADGFELQDLGEHRFKDLGAPERVFQLGANDFPPLKTLYQTNLPVPATPFVGRERELAEVVELLQRDEVRLLSLTGAGGTGKTRLALQAAGAAADGYPQGVWWAPLASVVDAASVLEAAGRALGATGPLSRAIGDRRLLLLLDNFEHVIEAATDLSALLADCPNLHVLVTSRERLRIAGEHVYPVPVLARAEARTLFTDRARALQPDFQPDDAVDELCERLDDLPLALELAAARIVMLTAEQLVDRLGRRLDFLRGGRDADVRQQTLRATIEWSYELLEPAERRLLARLAVFVGGCTLEAAEKVGDAGLDTLQSLVEKSLVRVRDGGRFWMLETIREFALERLAESGEEEALRRAHAVWFHELALEANLAEDARGIAQRHDLVLPEGANVRTAIDWAEARGDIELALSIAVELENFWATQDPYDGPRRLRRLLAHGGVEPLLRARALRAIGSSVTLIGGLDEAGDVFNRSLEEFRALGDEAGVARLLHRLAVHALWLGEPHEARRLVSQVQELLVRLRIPRLEAMLPGTLAAIERQSGNRERALELYLESARLVHEIGFTWWEGVQLANAGSLAHELGRESDSGPLFRDALRVNHAIRNRRATLGVLGRLAALAAEGGHTSLAGILWGALAAEEQRSPIGAPDQSREELEQRVGPVPEDAVSRGRALTLDEAVALALEAGDE
ncbi:MAG: hypothetical protein H0V68_02635, partial [Actinobacteria bacterium]|nr:hypothetical protein [Actinomycetota bacterium]